MDAVPNDSSLHSLTRKRKADGEDCIVQDSSSSDTPSNPEPMLLDPSATPRIPTEAQQHPPSTSWLLSRHHPSMVSSWQPPSPSSSAALLSLASGAREEGPSRPKRPRIEIPQPLPSFPRRLRRGGRTPYSSVVPSPRRFARHVRASEIRDTGIVSATEPWLSRVSFVHASVSPPSALRPSYSAPASPIEPISPHIPSHTPPINRDTLKELDLEAILRNPQLRHDLLFDSGLQFRPTSSRRKRELADNYWLSIVRELETGCTCFTLDAQGRRHERSCICSSIPMPSTRSIRASSPLGNLVTVRVPSRLKPLLCELLEVLISIIQPVVTRSSGLGVHANLLQPQYNQNLSHIRLLRSILDADLIQQEIKHGLFDPSGVFQAIGDIIRCYCAPMRDHAVDQMVKLAQSCAPGGAGTKADAVLAIRLCFEIMELMKLDVANHQLQTLRPYLVNSAAQFELKMFQENRQKGQLSLHVTRQWLRSAYSEVAEQSVALDTTVPVSRHFTKQSRHTQIQIAVTRATVNLIFDPSLSSLPSPSSASSVSSSNRSTPELPGYPETLYLDHNRLSSLTTDASDFTALYMLLMLYRQLVHTGSSSRVDFTRGGVKPDELLTLKKEIWEIGPQHPGQCFLSSMQKDTSDRTENKQQKTPDPDKWRNEISDVVLQLTMRTRSRSSIPPSYTSTMSTPDQAPPQLITASPDPAMLKLATSWTESNLRYDSPLSVLMRKRIRHAVEEVAIAHVVHSFKKPVSQEPNNPTCQDAGMTSGLEPLMPEINHLAEKLAKLVSIHMNVYGALYAQPGFLLD